MTDHTKLKVTEMGRMSVEDFRNSIKIPIAVVLDNVRSMYNVGSVFRTADAFRLEQICLCGITSTPPHPEIHKTALGAEDTVSWTHYDNTLDAVSELRRHGFMIIAIEQVKNSIMLQDFNINTNQKYALVFGNEVKGVQQEVVDLCDDCIEIPQFGTKHSLNVSVTAGIVMHHFARYYIYGM
ncbi:MAG: RNA methyltransferase [Bacteroidaceae bacterium]|nr:RNA methyltransferase [Bacteroidaceae bacterium]